MPRTSGTTFSASPSARSQGSFSVNRCVRQYGPSARAASRATPGASSASRRDRLSGGTADQTPLDVPGGRREGTGWSVVSGAFYVHDRERRMQNTQLLVGQAAQYRELAGRGDLPGLACAVMKAACNNGSMTGRSGEIGPNQKPPCPNAPGRRLNCARLDQPAGVRPAGAQKLPGRRPPRHARSLSEERPAYGEAYALVAHLRHPSTRTRQRASTRTSGPGGRGRCRDPCRRLGGCDHPRAAGGTCSAPHRRVRQQRRSGAAEATTRGGPGRARRSVLWRGT